MMEKVKEGQRRIVKARGHWALAFESQDHGNTCSQLLFSKLIYIVKLFKHLA